MDETVINLVKKKHDAPSFHYIFFDTVSVIQDVSAGYQNVENQLLVNDKTSYHAFSITKTFTAVAILQLVERGEISLHDSISSHIPSYDFSEPVTVRNLLCHQSGIANPLPLKWTHLKSEHSNFNYRAFSDSTILRHLTLKRSPGKFFSYSNLNYLVLGRLIEDVSGMEYQKYISRHILNRLPTDDFIGFDIPNSNHAIGYHTRSWLQNLLLGFLLDKEKMVYKADKDWNAFRAFYANGTPYGGIVSTPNALRTYCQELLKNNGKLLSKAMIDVMLTEQRRSKGKNTAMSLGWFKGNLSDNPYYCHAGGGGGYYAEIRLYPSLAHGSIIMTNSSGMKDDRILDYLDKKHFENLR